MRKMLYVCIIILLFPHQAVGSDLSEHLPAKIGELVRVQLVVGDAAQDEVDRLHGKALPAEASAIGRYARMDQRPAEVWLSRVTDDKEARRQTGRMVHMMCENPRSPFKNPNRVRHAKHAVYRFMGMGQVHLIWSSGDLVWWVSTPPAYEALFLKMLCR